MRSMPILFLVCLTLPLAAPAADLSRDQALQLGKDFGRFETVYFQNLAGRMGQQAYAFAELELHEEAQVTFGAGTDYWMQW